MEGIIKRPDVIFNEYGGFRLATTMIGYDHYITAGENLKGERVSAESTPSDDLCSMEKIQLIIDKL